MYKVIFILSFILLFSGCYATHSIGPGLAPYTLYPECYDCTIHKYPKVYIENYR